MKIKEIINNTDNFFSIDEDSFSRFCVGFLFMPVADFIINTTILLKNKPELISDGMAIIYVSLLTGLYYTLKHGKEATFNIRKEPTITFAGTFGLILFLSLSGILDKFIR